MTKKERIFAAINFKEIDRISTTYRASKYLSESLMKYFKIKDPGNFGKNYKKLLDKIGADFWSSGSKVDKFSTFIPEYKGTLPKYPYVEDGTLFYTLGIKSKIGKMNKYNIEYPNIGIDPPLANVDSPGEIKGFLTSKLELFNFKSMKNKYGIEDLKYKNIKYSNEDIICMGTLSSIFMICCYLRGMENFLIDLAYNIKIAEAIIDEVSEFCIEFNRQELLGFGGKAEYYGTWDDVAGQDGIMFSPQLFKKYFLPIYEKLIENVKKYSYYSEVNPCQYEYYYKQSGFNCHKMI